MLVKVQMAHLRSDNFVCVITEQGCYKYPRRMKTDKALHLVGLIIKAGYIDASLWESDN